MQDLGQVRLTVMVRAAHPLASRAAVTTTDFAAYPSASAIELSPGSFGGQSGAFVCDNFHILRDTVLGSDCIWLSSPAFVAQELREGRLVELPVSDFEPVDSQICLIVKRGRTRSPAADLVATSITEMLQDAKG